MSLFPDIRVRKLRLLAEMRAKEAQRAGLVSAEIVPPAKNKASIGKVLFFLGGLGVAVGYFVFGSDISSFLGLDKEGEKGSGSSSKREKDEASKLIDQIKLFQMSSVAAATPQDKPAEKAKPTGF